MEISSCNWTEIYHLIDCPLCFLAICGVACRRKYSRDREQKIWKNKGMDSIPYQPRNYTLTNHEPIPYPSRNYTLTHYEPLTLPTTKLYTNPLRDYTPTYNKTILLPTTKLCIFPPRNYTFFHHETILLSTVEL